jgi:phosphoglycolate phosphatase-like HAD superfamily hydrolase
LTAVFWDIDGTLLTTGKAGIFAWQEALDRVTGVVVDLWEFDTAGHPDWGIARRLLQEYARMTEPDPATLRRLVEEYESRLPSALHRRQGRVMPNVREILVALEEMPDVCSLLLTGNTRRGAAAKLTHYGLAGFFRGGGFSEDDGDRDMIARSALAWADQQGCRSSRRAALVVGDTPHDIRCARAVGARAVGVATGSYDAPALTAERPWRVLEQLPPPAEFVALIAEAEPAAGD